jgi:conjugal transfer pilus assembly protein TraB
LVLVSLSCLDRKGQAVIDQSLTGYVVDADGKAGLRGRVVTKMGAMITRSMLAGMFGGFGEALNSANTTTSITPIGGSISNIEPDKIGMAGVGKGLSNAFKEVQKFYMELAHQTMPVIEIGAARPLTLVITRGTTLDIKKLKGGK